MAPRKDNEESNDHKLPLPPQSAKFKVQSKGPLMSFTDFGKQLSEAKKSGNMACYNALKSIWPDLVDSYTRFAERARIAYIDRLSAQARIKGDYDLSQLLLRQLYCVPLQVGSFEWKRWVTVAKKQNFDFTPSEEDNRRSQWADVMDVARSLCLKHLCKIYFGTNEMSDPVKAAVLLQAMRDSLQDGSEERHLWIEKAKEWLTTNRPQVPRPKECDWDVLHSRYIEAMENGDFAKCSELLLPLDLDLCNLGVKVKCRTYIDWLYQAARIKGDHTKASHLFHLSCQLEESQEWEKWLAEAQRHNVSREEVNKRKEFANVVDRARLLREFHLTTLFRESVRSNDNVKATELSQAIREPLNEDSKEWWIWIEAAKKNIPDGHPTAYDDLSLQSYKKSYWKEIQERCAKVEESISHGGRPHGWIDFWRKRETIDHTEVDRAVQALREMENACPGKQGVLTTDLSYQMGRLEVGGKCIEVRSGTAA